MPRNRFTAWTEVTIRVPISLQETVITWAMDHGATGVQEDYPGLGDLAESGPILSGDPAEWSGDAPPNLEDHVTLRAWFPSLDSDVQFMALARDFLSGLPGGGPCDIRARRIKDRNWVASVRSEWRQIEVGQRLLVCPSFVRRPRAGDRVVLKLRPGMAFGTGTHFTTASCLRMVEDFMTRASDPFRIRVLDVGTGSGVLAIAALLLGAAEAIGIDLDREALREARQNARLNRVSRRLRIYCGPLNPDATGVFPLVVANLVADTLVSLADPLARSLAPGGRLVASGILLSQEAEVVEAFRSRGLTPFTALREGTWVTIAMDNSVRNGSTSPTHKRE